METALAEEPISPQLIRQVIREACIHGQIAPVLCGTALDQIGVQPVLDAVGDFLPSPLDMPPVEGTDPRKKKDKEGKAAVLSRKPAVDEPFCGLVFKIVADKHGDLCFVRVYSGTLKGNSRAYNPRIDKKENVSQLWHIQASHRSQIESVEAGDIVGVIGLRNSVTGDTLCDAAHPILLEPIQFPATVISMAIEPETSAERKKLAERLEMLKRQDPTFRAVESEETGQTLVSGMGELHLEIIKNRLLRDFNLNVKVHKPRVSYRETVAHAGDVIGECHRQLGGQTHFAKVRLRVEPQEKGETVSLDPQAVQQIPEPLLTTLVEALSEQTKGGGQLGHPLMNLRVSILGGEVREGETDETAVRIAAADAFDKGLKAAGVVLLEPVMRLEINTPEEFVGEFVSDLQQRRATITRTETRGRSAIIEALTPLANLFGYSSAMRSLSQGRASSSMEPSHYGPAPEDVLRTFL